MPLPSQALATCMITHGVISHASFRGAGSQLTARPFVAPPPPPSAHPCPALPTLGADLRLAQFFHGDLAGLTLRPGKLADKNVIDCLYTCKEGLDLQLPEDASRGVKVLLWAQHPQKHPPALPRLEVLLPGPSPVVLRPHLESGGLPSGPQHLLETL